jgi:Tfp pilus assembly protein PilF
MKTVLIFSIILLVSCSKRSSEEKLIISKKALENGEFLLAIDLVNEIIKVDSSNGEAYYLRATCKSKMPGIDNSSDDYQKCIELNYRVSDSYVCLGLNSISNGEDSLALVFFEKSIHFDPLNRDASFWKNQIEKRLIAKRKLKS